MLWILDVPNSLKHVLNCCHEISAEFGLRDLRALELISDPGIELRLVQGTVGGTVEGTVTRYSVLSSTPTSPCSSMGYDEAAQARAGTVARGTSDPSLHKTKC